MKLLIGKRPDDVKLLTDDGRDVIPDLHVTALTVTLRPGELTKVNLTCEFWETIDVEFDYSQVAITVEHVDMSTNSDDEEFPDD